jgi:hypothetical protein
MQEELSAKRQSIAGARTFLSAVVDLRFRLGLRLGFLASLG